MRIDYKEREKETFLLEVCRVRRHRLLLGVVTNFIICLRVVKIDTETSNCKIQVKICNIAAKPFARSLSMMLS